MDGLRAPGVAAALTPAASGGRVHLSEDGHRRAGGGESQLLSLHARAPGHSSAAGGRATANPSGRQLTMPLPHQRRCRAGAAVALPLPALAALLAVGCSVGPAAARGPDAPSVQDVAAQIKRQYDSVQSLHVKWRTTVDPPSGLGPAGDVDVSLFPTTVDEFAVS